MKSHSNYSSSFVSFTIQYKHLVGVGGMWRMLKVFWIKYGHRLKML